MTSLKFAITFALTFAISAISLYLMGLHSDTEAYVDIGWYAVGVFSLLSIVVFLLTNVISETKKKTLFIQVIMMNMIFKLFVSAAIVYIYYEHSRPDDGAFILPFIVIYVLYTVFETYFMNEQARAK